MCTGKEHQGWEEGVLGSISALPLYDYLLLNLFLILLDFFVVLGIEPKALYVPGKHSTQCAVSPALFTL